MKRLFFNIRYDVLICVFLVISTLTVYWQVRDHAFVNYDDNIYVTENPHVRDGLTFENITWAFTATYSANWHPLTWLLHMLNSQVYGMNAGGHHLTNVLFHIANTLLLFLVLFRMTRNRWRSGLVAALFALHPLHVESVAWVAGKDVLSTFFWMLTMWTYVRYAERPKHNRYLLVLFFFVLGLMSKPMLVTLPFVLLLMDYWPLGRSQWRSWTNGRNLGMQTFSVFRLVWEKIPLFALAIVSSGVTFLLQQKGETVASFEELPLKLRASNALVSYISYIGKMIWPHRLAVLYPYPEALPIWQVGGGTIFLIGISVVLVRIARSVPYLAVGWLWYVGTLVPVIGMVQVGGQAMADRYTYVPLIGLFISIVWGVSEFVSRWRYRRMVLVPLTGMLLLGCMMGTWLQVRYWKDSITLFRHSLNVTDNNYVMHNNLGVVLRRQGRLEEAIGHFSEALRLKPDYVEAHNNLGVALVSQGRLEEAIGHFSEALRLKPSFAETYYNLGGILIRQGRFEKALSYFSEALRLKPDYVEAHDNLGSTLARQGRLEEAIRHFFEALRLNPYYVKAHNNLGLALARQGRLEEAVSHFSEALRLEPGFATAHYNLGVVLMHQGRLEEAIGHFSEALRLEPGFAGAHEKLKEALAAQGKLK